MKVPSQDLISPLSILALEALRLVRVVPLVITKTTEEASPQVIFGSMGGSVVSAVCAQAVLRVGILIHFSFLKCEERLTGLVAVDFWALETCKDRGLEFGFAAKTVGG